MSIFNQRRYYFWVSLLLQSKLLSVALQNKAAHPIGTESPLLYSTCGCLVNEPVTGKLERKKIARFIEGFSVTLVCVCDRTTVKGKKREEMASSCSTPE